MRTDGWPRRVASPAPRVLRREGEAPCEGGVFSGGTWLLTFTDLVCLLLTFFVMTYAMSAPDPQRWQGVTSALSLRLNPAPADGVRRPTAAFNIGSVERVAAMNLDYLATLLKGQLAGSPDLAWLVPERRDDRLALSLPVDMLFATDRAELSDSGRRLLYLLSDTLGRIVNPIEIVALTDPDPADATAFRSRWELALTRAGMAAQTLAQAGYHRDIVLRASADPAWIDAPTPPRRVEILVLEGQLADGPEVSR